MIPVLILSPNQLPPDYTSLPAYILGSSVKLLKGRVYLLTFSSLLKASTNLIDDD